MDDALKLVKDTATAKFDESVDVAVNLGVDAKKSDQTVRGSVVLPAGTGKKVRVAVFAQGDRAKQAEEIAKTKQPDLTAADLDAAVRTIAGSARSMGLNVEGV